jgi:hypothetical protein
MLKYGIKLDEKQEYLFKNKEIGQFRISIAVCNANCSVRFYSLSSTLLHVSTIPCHHQALLHLCLATLHKFFQIAAVDIISQIQDVSHQVNLLAPQF